MTESPTVEWLNLPSLTVLDCAKIQDQSILIHREDPTIKPENIDEVLARDANCSLEEGMKVAKGRYKRIYNPKGISVHILLSKEAHPKPHPRTQSCYVLPISEFHDYFLIVDWITEEMRFSRETSQAEDVHPNVVHANLYHKSLSDGWMGPARPLFLEGLLCRKKTKSV